MHAPTENLQKCSLIFLFSRDYSSGCQKKKHHSASATWMVRETPSRNVYRTAFKMGQFYQFQLKNKTNLTIKWRRSDTEFYLSKILNIRTVIVDQMKFCLLQNNISNNGQNQTWMGKWKHPSSIWDTFSHLFYQPLMFLSSRLLPN